MREKEISKDIKIDDEDKELLINGYSLVNGYITIGTRKFLHKIIAERIGLTKGQIRFKNKNRKDCRRENLYNKIKEKPEVLVSDEDKDLLKYDYYVNKGRVIVSIGKDRPYLHKIIAKRIGINDHVKFKNNNKIDCRRENLDSKETRKKKYQEQILLNRKKFLNRIVLKSGYNPRLRKLNNNKYQLLYDDKYLGTFNTQEEAKKYFEENISK